MNDVSSAQLSHIPEQNLDKSYRYTVTNNTPVKTFDRIHLYSTQPQSPVVHTLHSEWIDSYNNTPIPSPSKMSSTITQAKYETPVKAKVTAYMTPESSDNKLNTIKFDEKSLRSSSMTPTPVDTIKSVSNVDVILSMMNIIAGKDKMSKVGQYLLRLLIYHANQTRDLLSTDTINIDAIDNRYNDRSKKLNLIHNFIRHPMDFARIVVILFCSRFSKRFQGMVGGIGTYRQFLRFGKTPFRVRDLYSKINGAITKNQPQTLLNKKFLGELIGFYYGAADETLLLFKLGILTNKSLRKAAGRHESLAWYYDSILGIYTAIENINKTTQQEMELKIQIQVKNKARSLSKQILGLDRNNKDSSSLYQYLNENSNGADVKALKDIQFKKFDAYLDLYKWLCDFIFDSYTVFHVRLPFNTLQIWFGLMASCLSTFKIYRDTRRKLSSK